MYDPLSSTSNQTHSFAVRISAAECASSRVSLANSLSKDIAAITKLGEAKRVDFKTEKSTFYSNKEEKPSVRQHLSVW